MRLLSHFRSTKKLGKLRGVGSNEDPNRCWRGKQGASVVVARAAAAEEGSQLSKFRKLSLTLHGEK